MTLNQWAEGIRVSVRHTPGEHYSSSAENVQVALDQRWAGLLVATSARDPLPFIFHHHFLVNATSCVLS